MNSIHEIIAGIAVGLVMVAYLWIIWTLKSKKNSTKYSSSPRALRCRSNVERLVTGANPSDELSHKTIELNICTTQSLPSISPGLGLNLDTTATSHSETHKTSPMNKIDDFHIVSARLNQAIKLEDKTMWQMIRNEYHSLDKTNWPLEDILAYDRISSQGIQLFSHQSKK